MKSLCRVLRVVLDVEYVLSKYWVTFKSYCLRKRIELERKPVCVRSPVD